MTRGTPFRRFFFALFFLPSIALVWVTSLAAQQNTTWEQDLSIWRTQHAVELQKPDGWLALVGLVWLEPGDNSVGSAADNQVRLPGGGPAHVDVLRLKGTTVS